MCNMCVCVYLQYGSNSFLGGVSGVFSTDRQNLISLHQTTIQLSSAPSDHLGDKDTTPTPDTQTQRAMSFPDDAAVTFLPNTTDLLPTMLSPSPRPLLFCSSTWNMSRFSSSLY